MAVVCSKVLFFEPPLIYTAPDTCVFGAVIIIINIYNAMNTDYARIRPFF